MSERRYPHHKIRDRILTFIEEFQATHHRAPNVRELMQGLNGPDVHNTRVYDVLRYLKQTRKIVLMYEIRK